MIIVSQGKEEIINLDNIQRLFIDADYISAVIYVECIEDDILIGSYKTEERAKEVLAEITEFWKNGAMSDYKDFICYEMPED